MSKTMICLRRQVAVTAALAATLLSGCRVGPKYNVPPATAQAPPATYKETPAQTAGNDTWKPAQPQDAMLRGKWWEIYNEPELNALEDKLNIDNQNIKVSFENYMSARTLIAQARAQLYPTLSTSPTWTRSKSSGGLLNAQTANPGRQATVINAPAAASWAPDLWGRIRNTISQQQANAQLSAADLENERLIEQADLATTFFEVRGQDALIEILKQTIEADKKALDFAQNQYDAGIGDKISVVEAQNTLQSVQAAEINLHVARNQFEHAIAVLVGTNPSSFNIPVKSLLRTPPAIPVGIPSQLLERRPDIAASERALEAANAQIGIATAAYYPNLTLSASGGFQSSQWSSLFDWPSRIWSIGPSISETVFDAGLRRATVRQFVATYNADVATYRQTVLNAFQQVEDNLSTVQLLSQQIKQEEQAVESARQFVELQTARYETGVDPYVNVVTAQTTLLSDQQTLAQLHIQQMTSSVSLIQALGGGWDRTQLPTKEQVSQKLNKADYTIQK